MSIHLIEFSLNAQIPIDSLVRSVPTKSAINQDIPAVTGALLMIGIQQIMITGRIITNRPSDIISCGICWSSEPHPSLKDVFKTSDTDTGRFNIRIDNLSPGTVYFVRAFARTLSDTLYGDERAFYTHKENSICDVDSNFYNIVQIGNQVWLAEDLKTTHFNDGALIPTVAEPSLWGWTSTPAWCWYGNDSAKYSFPRGKLYNWHAVGTGKICPVGWHVPNDLEWATLSSFLGGDSISGGQLKTPGTVFWREPNKGATNSSGFSSFPGGYRNSSGRFSYGTIFNYWWSSDKASPEAASNWYVYHAETALYHQISLNMFGYSIRCIKNE